MVIRVKRFVADIAREIGIIFLIGVMPLTYAFVFGGANIAEQVLLKLLVDSRMVAYFLAGAVICLLIAWIEHRLVFRSNALEGGHRFVTSILASTISLISHSQ